ncbi:uncharacterized protein C8Q71DRAFT_799041 [Rhodofomes roseus]|uniref:Uncharacterized protein n=1 Tax=Rhodofomes roseus TaxID=34475 RepID=A0ABQ8K3M6_9APHY|nr:uncharacterized protein C8Q71DRAFT_799041 [Rhodofomes roseus]KAH9831474.1 hypothetical protein C8Q71DRAFT_799041 [Rhodofomes roseus]
MTQGPSPRSGLTRSLTHKEHELVNRLDRLKFFLATVRSRWSGDNLSSSAAAAAGLPSGLYHCTGTDIVRALVFRFEAFGRLFEEGVFSGLWNLKPGMDACLEEHKFV